MNQSMKENTKHRVRLSKVLLHLILSAAIVFGSMPCKPFVMEVKADTPAEKTITGLDLGRIDTVPTPPGNAESAWNGDYVYFGKYDGTPMKYRVLSCPDRVLLDCDNVLKKIPFSTSNNNSWEDSEIRKWLQGDEFYNNTAVFTAAEKNAIIADPCYDIEGISEGLTPYGYTNVGLSDPDPVFVLNVSAVTNHSWLGYYNDIEKSGTRKKTYLDGKKAQWWLRSSYNNDSPKKYVGGVKWDGQVEALSVDDAYVGVSPALYLDTAPILYSSLVYGSEGQAGSEYKLTVKDEGLSVSYNNAKKEDNRISVSYTLEDNSESADPTQISVVVTDKKWDDETKSVIQYTKLEMDSFGSSGTGTFTLDSHATGTWGEDYHVYILAEDVNGTYETDYASEPVELELKTSIQASAEDVEVTYDGKPHSISVNIAGDTEGVTVKYGSSADDRTYESCPTIKNVSDSPKTIYYQVEAEGYLPAKGSATVKITPRAVTVTADDKTKPYDNNPETDPALTAAVSGAVDGETINYTLSRQSGQSAGDYEITVTPGENPNYDVQAVNGTFTITKADPSITPPTAKVNLTYDGSAHELITEGSVTGGTLYYAVTTDNTAPTDENLYTTSIPTETNAGTYYVWYKVIGYANHNDVAAAEPLTVAIAKADFTNKTVSGNTKYGLSGTIELKELIAPGGTVGTLKVEDTDNVLEGEPSLTGTVLSYSFKSDAQNVGKAATVTIPVSNATNYNDYPITVTLNVIDCDHKNTERRDMKEATCVSKGHTGKLYCLDCGTILDEGEEIPIDPDNHQFDEGKVTTQPTIFKEGVKTFICIRGCGHSYTVAIPRLEGEEDLSDLVEDTADLSGNDAPKIEEKKDENGNTIEETVTIGGEEISKTVVDPKTGKETVETKVWIGGLQSSYTYTGSSIKPSINVYDGTRKLTAGQDYSISYKNNKDAGKATVTVKFKGNYKGAKSETEDFTITPAVLGQDIIAHETGVAVKKKAQKPVPVLTWKETGKEVNSKYFSITYEPGTVREAGTYTATIKPKNAGGNFTGSTTALIKVADKSKLLSNAKVTFDKKSYPYIGTAITPKYTLTLDGAALTEGRDYRRVSIADNTYPGKAAVIFEAVSTNSAGYVGSKTATFKISGKKELKEGAAFSCDVAESVTYAKGGAKPEVTVKDKERGVILKEGQDYTLSYAKNKAVTNGSKIGEVRIKGKGNYKGKVTLYFAVAQQSLKAEGIAISAADQFTTRQKLKKPTVTIIDIDGKKLKEGTDYTVGQTDASDSKNTEKQGVVSFTVKGKGNYKDETIAATFRYEEKSSNIGKSKAVKKIADQAYTGKAVQLSNTELEGVLSLSGKTLVPGTDFKIISTGYSNNVKKGTARVTVQGINTYAGTKTLTFKIVQGKVDYQGALVGGTWQ